MKKAITIPKIEEQLYNRVKEKAEATNQSVSDYVSSLFEKELNEETDEESKELLEKNKEFSERIKELEYCLSEKQQYCLQLQKQLEAYEEQEELLLQLQKQLKATEEENEQFLKIDPNKITVEFDDLERALIYFICERESKRVGKEIYPNQLLKAMFVNYSIKGDSYFFKHPTRSEILELKKKLNTENND